MKVLIIEDEKRLAEFIFKGLIENGYQCEVAYDGRLGAELALNHSFDIILMDVNMPYINGFDLTKKLRENDITTPILLLTAMGLTSDKITGLDSGADDYLVKPFEFQELLARIRALVRRAENFKENNNDILKLDDLELNLLSKKVTRSSVDISLTSKEFNLLHYLLRNKNQVLSKARIFSEIWDQNADMDSSKVEVYINLLRNKIDREPHKKLLHTVVGFGYVIKDS